jgi:hypothetical protein
MGAFEARIFEKSTGSDALRKMDYVCFEQEQAEIRKVTRLARPLGGKTRTR